MATRAQRGIAKLLLQCFDLCEEAGFDAHKILVKYILGDHADGLYLAIYHGLRRSHILKGNSSDYCILKPVIDGATEITIQGFPHNFRTGQFKGFKWLVKTKSLPQRVKLPPNNPNHLKSGYYYTIKSTKALIQACLNVPVVAERFTEKVRLEAQKVLITHI